MTAFSRLENLGEEKFNALKDEIIGGIPVQTIARKIQQDWKDFGDVSEATLAQQLRRFKMFLESQETPELKDLDDIDVEESYGLDCKKELEDLIKIQKSRITILVEKEKTMPMPFPVLGPMIKDCVQMVRELEIAQKAETEDLWSALFSPVEGL